MSKSWNCPRKGTVNRRRGESWGEYDARLIISEIPPKAPRRISRARATAQTNFRRFRK
jgi:hypothetical protein